jgi:hypothetical protein
MTLNEAFDNLKAARREDDGSTKALLRIYNAAVDLAWAALAEKQLRRNKKQTTEPKTTNET